MQKLYNGMYQKIPKKNDFINTCFSWTMSSKKVKTEIFVGPFTLKVRRMEPLFQEEYAGPHFRKIWNPK